MDNSGQSIIFLLDTAEESAVPSSHDEVVRLFQELERHLEVAQKARERLRKLLQERPRPRR